MTTPKEPTACALCGTDPARGNASVWISGIKIPLCHGDEQKVSCYVQWTVYNKRPEGYEAPTVGTIFTQPFRELAEEFRRLAAEADEKKIEWGSEGFGWEPGWSARAVAFTEAAQMTEDKLNG